MPPWVAKEKIETLLLASEMPVPIPRSRTVGTLSRNGGLSVEDLQCLLRDDSHYKGVGDPPVGCDIVVADEMILF